LSENLLPLSSQTGRGTATNPFIICTAEQLKSLSGTMPGVYAVLAEDIKISQWLVSDLISNFAGELNGLGHSIYGLDLFQNAYTGNLGIFTNNMGKILNLNIVGNKIVNYNGVNSTGILAGNNSGTIQKISMFNNSVEGVNYAGMVTGSNSGLINDVYINEGSLSAVAIVGGVAGYNIGTISRSSVNSKIMNIPGTTNYHKFGGVVGFNAISGIVDQVVYAGQINLGATSTETQPFLGGIIGYNNGVLSNAMTKKYSTLNVMNSNTVGGLIGFNSASGSLKKSLSFGKVLFSNGIIPAYSTFSQTVGSNAGLVEVSSTFLLENNSAGFLGAASVNSCSGNFTIMGANPTYLTAAAVTSGTHANLILYDYMSSNYADNIGLNPFTITSNYTISSGTCTPGETLYFYKGFEPSLDAKKTANELNNVETYSDFNLVYEDEGPYAIKMNELIAFYKSRMYKTPMPAGMVAPIWVFEDYEGPRLLQVND
jgi:hypothetical protein